MIIYFKVIDRLKQIIYNFIKINILAMIRMSKYIWVFREEVAGENFLFQYIEAILELILTKWCKNLHN